MRGCRIPRGPFDRLRANADGRRSVRADGRRRVRADGRPGLRAGGRLRLRAGGGCRSHGSGCCQTRHLWPVSSHHGLLLLAAPTLDLPLRCQGFLARGEFLREHQVHRPPLESMAGGNGAGFMLADALFKLVGVSGVVAVIDAAQNVDPEAHEFDSVQISLAPGGRQQAIRGLLRDSCVLPAAPGSFAWSACKRPESVRGPSAIT